MTNATCGFEVLKFIPYKSFVHSNFWHKFYDIKVNQDKLEEVTRCIWGYLYYLNRPGAVLIDSTAFNQNFEEQSNRQYAVGYHLNYNTIEGFQKQDKSALLKKYIHVLMEDITSGKAVDHPNRLIFFVLTTFADLKYRRFHYWFAFPAVSHGDYIVWKEPIAVMKLFSKTQMELMIGEHNKLEDTQKCFFFVNISEFQVSLITLKEFVESDKLREDYCSNEGHLFLAFLDSTVNVGSVGWLLRNVLFLLNHHCPELQGKALKVLSLRGENTAAWLSDSLIITIKLKAKLEGGDGVVSTKEYIGWEAKDNAKYVDRFVDLSDSCDPSRLIDQAVDLNLKLIKWRYEPNLNLDVIKQSKFLLLGAGALGCQVARILLAWGVKYITFVDCGVVSSSNPCRQSLYTQADCMASKHKSLAAAETLKKINPCVESQGVVMTIPMPGHDNYKIEDVRLLESLIENNDVIFLITDSRESRWLPTLFSSLKRKLAITIALGYETYLVMRHGIRNIGKDSREVLGCYFCNDVVAPGNSSNYRTLDQQCTVSRPSATSISSAMGVELAISILQHEDGARAPSDGSSCLGRVPHSIRGSLRTWEQMFPSTPAFDKCTACSNAVLNEYEQRGIEFLLQVFKDPTHLEKVSGLDIVHREAMNSGILELDDAVQDMEIST